MAATSEMDNEGAPSTYGEVLQGPDGKKKVVVKCIDLITDSQSAKSLAENSVYHGLSKHILAKWHFIRERVTKGWIKLFDVRTELMGADMMTKAVGPSVLAVNTKLIGMSKSG